MLNKYPAIEVKNLSKSYRDVKALEDISLVINRGELFGVIGPDGSGKSTLFRLLTTLLLPDSGTATVLGYDIVKDYSKIRKVVGYMPGRFSLYGDLSVNENLNLFASLFGVTVVENYHLIEHIFKDLAPFGNRKASQLSGGMKQKLALCCALIHKPELLFLDEPTTGVDPVSRREFWSMLDLLKLSGITIVVSTAYMDEALICDRIALMKNGRVLSCNTPSEMAASYKNRLLAVWGDNMPSLLRELREISFVKSAYSFGSEHHVSIKGNNPEYIQEIERYLYTAGHTNFYIKIIPPVIEDCYMELSS